MGKQRFWSVKAGKNEKEEDFYELLGVKRDATSKEISIAYRVQAKRHHPDKVVNRKVCP